MQLLKALMIRRFLVGVAGVLVATGPAQAVTLLATGLVWNNSTSAGDNNPQCFAANVGATPVRVNSMKIITFDGAVMPAQFLNCNFPGDISPGLACIFVGEGRNSFALVRCVIEVATPTGAKSIRGTLMFYDPQGDTQILEAH